MRDHAGGTPNDPDRWVELLDRALAGECTPTERLELDGLLAADPALSAHVDTLRRGMQPPAADVLGLDRSARAARLLTALDIPAAASSLARPSRRQRARPSRGRLLGVGMGAGSTAAAVVAIAVVMLALGFGLGSLRRDARTGHSPREYATLTAQRQTVLLPDGTQFTLGPASRLTLAPDYGVHTRELTLEGEAYFTVIHDPRKPFVVRAANAITADVGTRFDVRSYAGDPGVRVAVLDGTVAVRAARRAVAPPVAVGSGELVEVTPAGALVLTRDADVSALTGWTAGQLAFSDTPLPMVIRDLERWYGLDIEVTDPALAARLVTATLGGASPTDALDALAASLDARADRRGDTVTLIRLHHSR